VHLTEKDLIQVAILVCISITAFIFLFFGVKDVAVRTKLLRRSLVALAISMLFLLIKAYIN
jgi:positive regulator of sigma E activity